MHTRTGTKNYNIHFALTKHEDERLQPFKFYSTANYSAPKIKPRPSFPPGTRPARTSPNPDN